MVSVAGSSSGGWLQLSPEQQYLHVTPVDRACVSTLLHSELFIQALHSALVAHPLMISLPACVNTTVVKQYSCVLDEQVPTLGDRRQANIVHVEHLAATGAGVVDVGLRVVVVVVVVAATVKSCWVVRRVVCVG